MESQESKLKCVKCDKVFRSGWHLRRHALRKTPCDCAPPTRKYKCVDCDHTFTEKRSLQRHCKTCKKAPSTRMLTAEDLDNLDPDIPLTQLAEIVAKLLGIMKQRATGAEPGVTLAADKDETVCGSRKQTLNKSATLSHSVVTESIVQPIMQSSAPVRINAPTHIPTIPFDRKTGCIAITKEQIESVCTQNRKITEYLNYANHESDADKALNRAQTCAVDAVVDLVIFAHRSIECRNIHRHPSQPNQVLIYDESGLKWRPEQFEVAVEKLLADTAMAFGRITRQMYGKFPSELEAVYNIPQAYSATPPESKDAGKQRIRAHLDAMSLAT
jgi:hypothetical protein